MVENPDVSSGGLPTNKTRMERTPKTIDGLVQEEIFFLLSVSFPISNQNANHKVLCLVAVVQR